MSEYVEARVVSIKKEVYVVHTLSKKIPLLVRMICIDHMSFQIP